MGFGLNGFGTAQNAMVAEHALRVPVYIDGFGTAQNAMVAEPKELNRNTNKLVLEPPIGTLRGAFFAKTGYVIISYNI